MHGENRHALVGISVKRVTPRYDTTLGTNPEIEPLVMNAIGFKDVGEYIDAYPGGYMTDSLTAFARGLAQTSAYTWKNNKYIILSGTMHNEKGILAEINLKVSQYIKNSQNGVDFMLLLQPTIEEMHLVRGCKSIKEKDLWFCSNWKG